MKILLVIFLFTLISCGKSFTITCKYKGEIIQKKRTNLIIMTGGDAFDECIIKG